MTGTVNSVIIGGTGNSMIIKLNSTILLGNNCGLDLGISNGFAGGVNSTTNTNN